jgi:beta-lactamase regulating signal transducer with metallopeptidase domain
VTLPDLADPFALLLRATLLMGAAWAAASALRRAGAPAAARHLAWLLGIAALLALPFLWWLLPALRLPILPAEAATAAAPSAATTPSVLAGPISAEPAAGVGWTGPLLAVYLVGAASLLLRLVVGRRMLRRLWSEAGAPRGQEWEQLISQLTGEMGLSRRVELRISRRPAVPMTWGTLAPKVLLPADAVEWPAERRRLVLLHELAHVARRDSLSRSLASLACALYWFHPGAWFAARRMRMEQEHAADDRVLIAGGSAQAYAHSLLHLARGIGSGQRFDQAAAMGGLYQLERRLVSITSPARRNRPGAAFLSSSGLFAALATLVVAAGVPVSASPTALGPVRAKRADTAARPAGPGDRRATPARRPAGGTMDRVERFVGESDAVSESRAAGAAQERAARRDDGSREIEPPVEEPRRDSRDSPASAVQLRDYGWELQRRDSPVAIGSTTDSARAARLILPAAPGSASSERTDPPRWARNVPRLVRGRPPTGSPIASQGPVVLSWSIDVLGKK